MIFVGTPCEGGTHTRTVGTGNLLCEAHRIVGISGGSHCDRLGIEGFMQKCHVEPHKAVGIVPCQRPLVNKQFKISHGIHMSVEVEVGVAECICLLYTSDAADEARSVGVGGGGLV